MTPYKTFFAPFRLRTSILLILASNAPLLGQDFDPDPQTGAPAPASEGEAIVSEKDAVDLVDDSSIGEAIQRRPDLDFSNVTIDGEDSNLSLDSISANSVASVEVLKAVTPDLDADSRGGSISLRSKPAYEQEQPNYQGSVESSYHSLFEEFGYDSRFSMGGPINKARTWGGRLAIRRRETVDGNESVFHDWKTIDYADASEFVLKTFGVEVYKRERTSSEINGFLDYKASESLSFFWRASYENTDSFTILPQLRHRIDDGTYINIGEDEVLIEGSLVQRSLRAWEGLNDELETAIGGAFQNESIELDFKFTYKEDDYEEPDYFVIDFRQEDVDLRYTLEEPLYPVLASTDGKDLEDASAFAFEDVNSQLWQVQESDAIGAFNLKWLEPFDRKHVFLKAGVKSRLRERDQFSGDKIYDRYDGSFTLEDALSTESFPEHSQGRYSFDTFPDVFAARAFIANDLDGFELNERRTREQSDPNTYLAEEQVDSIYGMINWEREKFRALVGWRHEATTVTFVGNEVVLGEDETGDTIYIETNATRGESKYANDFPNAHFRYRWNENITFIGSYTNTIKRPNYRSVVPFRRVNLEDRSIDEGNPDLRPTLYANWDLSADIELPNEGLLSIELFEQSVEDFIFERKSIQVGGIYDGFELERNENSSNATARGATITWKQSLKGFGIPEGLRLNVNYTTQSSEIEYPERLGEILPLAFKPEQIFKLTLTYESERFFVQLKQSYQDLAIREIAAIADEDRYRKPHTEIDLNLNYRIKPKVRLFVDLKNLTNTTSYNNYEGDPSRPNGYRYREWTGAAGMKFEL